MFDDPAIVEALGVYAWETAPLIALLLDADGVVVEANVWARRLFGDGVVGRPFAEQVVDFTRPPCLDDLTAQPDVAHRLTLNAVSGTPETLDFRFVPLAHGALAMGAMDVEEQQGLRDRALELNHELSNLTRRLYQTNAELGLEIAARERAEEYRAVARDALQILNEPGEFRVAIGRVIETLRVRTGIDAVGLRLQMGDDFPYIAQEGFPNDFLLTENTLTERSEDGGVCRDENGKASLECTCGLVIRGGPVGGHPLFTAGGSFWTNDSPLLLDLPVDQDPRYSPRNECIHRGYASVALVPIRNADKIVGLIHLNDRKKDRFSLETVELLEGIASSIGSALMRKEAEERQRQLEAELQRAQKLDALRVLVAGVAHNVNNVLATVMGAASLRGRLAVAPEDVEAFATIGMASRRAREIVKSLMQFAHPAVSNPVPFELNALISEFRVFLREETQGRIEIVEALSEEPLWICGDAAGVSDAYMNICMNALEAMPDGGTLTLRTVDRDGDWVEISVEDTGTGMTPEVLGRAMEPFFTTKSTVAGTGLGLSLVHGVINAHGGGVDIVSSPGQGTTVKLRLPRISAPGEAKAARSRDEASVPMRVLLVDDDEDVRYIVNRMLKAAGMQTQADPSGEDALERLSSGDVPDLVILDQNMPRMSGMQTMEKILELHPGLPILISSGQPDVGEWECFRRPNVAVISKPFDMDEIRSKLAGLASDGRHIE